MIPANAILTPHPKEFDRLAGESDSSFARFLKQQQFAKDHQCVVLLKGAFTSIALPDGRVYFNSSGNPLLATAGSGDVLTGIITSFLAQGYQAAHAAILGAYVHGLCADRRWQKGHGSMLASAIIEEIPQALYALGDL
jgi:ADP-dependent NAD(P)H-hydrate dehydratase / NAD(P)H-hydrate epimerase